MQKVEKANILNKQEKIRLRKNFQEIGNIRPYSATLRWLLYQIKKNEFLKEIIEDTIDEVMVEFNNLKFVDKWYKHHNKWYNPFDTADMIQMSIYCLEKLRVFSFEKILNIVNNAIEKFSSHYDIKGAQELFISLNNNIHFVIMGHTHFASQIALFTDKLESNKIRESMYLNTGTWIKNYYECDNQLGFIGWKNMNYVIVYTPKEKPNKHNLPVFETWQGTEKREE